MPTSVQATTVNQGSSQGDAKIIKLPPPAYLYQTAKEISSQYEGNAALETFYSSNNTDEDFTRFANPRTLRKRAPTSPLAISVIRTQFSKDLLEDLKWLSENFDPNDPTFFSYVNRLLSTIQEYFENYFTDPFSSYLIALYDGLSNNNAYLDLNKSIYKQILHHIEGLNNQNVDYKKVQNYIFKLEELGLNITPY